MKHYICKCGAAAEAYTCSSPIAAYFYVACPVCPWSTGAQDSQAAADKAWLEQGCRIESK